MTHHATKTLQELGYRLTPQRTLVWDVLRASNGHMSAEEVCAQIQTSFPHINISTIYRTLELLVELRLVRETQFGPKRRFFEVEEEVPHHHLVCERCGSVAHVHDEDLGSLHSTLANGQRFAAKHLTIFGVCGPCAASEAPASAEVAASAQSAAPAAPGAPAAPAAPAAPDVPAAPAGEAAGA